MNRWIPFALLCCAPVAHAAVFTVGPDAACTHHTILAAVVAAGVNGPGTDEIRITSTHIDAATSWAVASQNLHVRGGFSDCSDSTPGAPTVLIGSGAGSNPVFFTSGVGTSTYTLTLENLHLRDGGNDSRAGGALRVAGKFAVELVDVTISNYRAARGGAVYVDGSEGGSLILRGDTRIRDNVAAISGGGIYCIDGGGVTMDSGAITGNRAEDLGADGTESGNGGGVALYGCGMLQRGQAGIRGVLDNAAARFGGGYYLRGGAAVSLLGTNLGAAYLAGNEAVLGGGGVAVLDVYPPVPGALRSSVVAWDSRIEDNRAPYGAGVALFIGGNLQMRRTLEGEACHSLTHCSTLAGNDRYDETLPCIGAALFAGEGSTSQIFNTRIEGNCPSDVGWAFRQRLDSEIRIESSLILRNGGAEPFFIEGDGTANDGSEGFTGLLQIAWSTIAGHFDAVRSGMFTLPTASPSSGTLRVLGSILAEPFLRLTAGGAPPMSLDFDCLIVDPAFVGPTVTERITEVAAPYGMVNPGGGNYEAASGTAPPVDYCDASRGARVLGDFLGRTGVFDSPRSGGFGLHDVGAFERDESAAPGAIFRDGFEVIP